MFFLGRTTTNEAAAIGALVTSVGESRVQIGGGKDSIESIGAGVITDEHKKRGDII